MNISNFMGWWSSLGSAGGLSTNRLDVTKNSSRGHDLKPFFVMGLRTVKAPIILYPSAENPVRPNVRYSPALSIQGAFNAQQASQLQQTKTYYNDQAAQLLTTIP